MKTPSLSEVQLNPASDSPQTNTAEIRSVASTPTPAEPSSRKALSTNAMPSAEVSKTVSANPSKEEIPTEALQEADKTLSEHSPGKLVDVVDIYLQQAEAYCNESQWEKAIAACKEAISIVPTAASAYKLLGNILQKQDKPTDAMGFYAKALALQPDSPEIYSNLGSLYARKQCWEQAIAYFQKAIDKDPKFAAAHSNLAKVWKKLGEADQELACLQTALQLQPDMGSARSYYRVAQSLEEKDKAEAAIEFYRQAIARSPDFLPAYQRLVDLLEDQGNWQSAVTYYRKVIELTAQHSANSPTTIDAQNREIVQKEKTPDRLSKTPSSLINPLPESQTAPKLQLAKRDQQLVQKLLQASSKKQLLQPLAKVRPDNRLLQPARPQKNQSRRVSEAAQMGARYAKAQDWPRAIRYFQQAIQDQPQSPELYRAIAAALTRSNQPQQAAIAWYRAFTLDSSWPNAQQYLQVGNALFKQRQLEAATNCYRQAIRLQPTLSAAYHQLAQLLRSQGNLEMADAVLQQLETVSGKTQTGSDKASWFANGAANGALSESVSSSTDRKDAQALDLHKQGERLQQQEKWEEAIALYQAAAELNPTFSWLHHNLGDCYKKIRQWSAAATAYQRAIRLKPDFIWSHYSLAEVAEAQADWPAATRHYRHALELDPENAQIPPRLSSVLRQLIDIEPRNVDRYRELAEIQTAQGHRDEAIATYRMALQICPDEPTVALALSKLIAKQDPQQAHELIDRALSRTVTNQDIQSRQDLQDFETVAALLSATHLFDPQYYRATNPELSTLDNRELLMHYLRRGSAEGKNPNPLFDEEFYRDRHPELANTNSLAHFHCFGYLAGDDPHPFFKTAFYRKTHRDVAAANINPLEHYLASGAKEGRVAFAAEQLSHRLEQPTPVDAEYLSPWIAAQNPPTHKTISPQKLAVYCSSLGNNFITETADVIVTALQQAGHSVIQFNEQNTPPDNIDGHWVIAPNEFFYLGEGPQWAQRSQWLSQAVVINVEQPQTTWFSKAFHFLRHARIIFDINVKSTAILRSLQLPAYWLPIGYLPRYAEATASTQLRSLQALKSLPVDISDYLPKIDAPLSDRPIDLHFIGTASPRREQFFAKSAPWLEQFCSFLHILPMGDPLPEGENRALDTAAVVGLSRRSKILLNIHCDELPYFEWQRIVFHGLWQNTLVVTEPCHDIPGLVAGEHFIECPLSEMHSKIKLLLQDPDGQKMAEKVRRAGHQAIKERFDGSAITASALQLVQQTPCPIENVAIAEEIQKGNHQPAETSLSFNLVDLNLVDTAKRPAQSPTVEEKSAGQPAIQNRSRKALQLHAEAERLREQENWHKAVDVYRDAIVLDPDNGWSYNGLGESLMRLEQFDEAVGVLKTAIDLNPSFVWGYLNLGTVLQKSGQLDEAIAIYRRATEASCDAPEISTRLADALWLRSQKEREQASALHLQSIGASTATTDTYHRALEGSLDSVELYCGLADRLLAEDNFTAAIVFCDIALQLDNSCIESNSKMGIALARNKEYDSAIPFLKKAVASDATALELYTLGYCLDKNQAIDEAINFYEMALAQQADYSDCLIRLGLALSKKKKFDRAMPLLLSAQKIDPTRVKVWEALAEAHLSQGNLDEALRHCEQSIAIANNRWSAHRCMGDILVARGQLSDAVESYKTVVDLNANFKGVHNALADVYRKLAQWPEAKAHYEIFIQSHHTHYWAHRHYAHVLSQMGLWDEAVNAYETINELNPNDDEMIGKWEQAQQAQAQAAKSYIDKMQQAKNFVQQNNLEEAIAAIEAAIKVMPDRAEAHHELGNVLQKQEKFDDAMACWIRTINNFPNFKHTYYRLAWADWSQVGPNRPGEAVLACRNAIAQLKEWYLPALVHTTIGDILTAKQDLSQAMSAYQASALARLRLKKYDLENEDADALQVGKQPDFLIIGGMRCGSTSLHHYLSQHPNIITPCKKEIHFFNEKYDYGIDWYLSHFPPTLQNRLSVTGEATPFLASYGTPEKVAKHLPDVKLIAVLRNPVDRALSHYHHATKWENNPNSFESSVESDLKNLQLYSQDLDAATLESSVESAYLKLSMYAYWLEEWMKIVPAENFLVIQSEELYRDPASTTSQVYRFLGVSPHELSLYAHTNKGVYNQLNDALQAKLNAFFKPHNEKLERLLGRDLNW